MNIRQTSTYSLVIIMGCMTRSASAQVVVIDPTSLTQIIQQVQQLSTEIALAERALAQAQQTYAAITGSRNMQNLLSGQNRNYLPTTWSQLTGAMNGNGGTYASLGSSVSSNVSSNAVLTTSQTSKLSASELDSLTQRRQAIALSQALASSALSTNSNRFSSLQTLISAISSATDEKGILDLHARIAAEQTMLQTEATKLDTLYRAAQIEQAAEQERSDEKAINDIGSLSQLPAMGLGDQ